jgi:hypothetical protein
VELIEDIWSPPLHGTTVDQADTDRRRWRRETAPAHLSRSRKSAAASRALPGDASSIGDRREAPKGGGGGEPLGATWRGAAPPRGCGRVENFLLLFISH